ncbi:hypothetical protein HBI56_115730 [Parastagonospora nodorum]|nr:hypothetical protein HBI95_053510 [Parastagonospora nodorum]KAH5255090.1 hypothetical protein HBI71_134520 [Parastagonospora nodorum]KAH5271100.1 hypothetical protein HBI70_120170 [Parastagonospora nodorum]KAH5792911.1 hypothetical protein HBI97_040840 [Parastagonospora nodorum]KAH5876966.1 hypothetical protein HBI90_062320 [Parastagonospora nodorum]
MHMKDLDAAIESLGFQLSPLEAFVEAELARTNIGGEPIIKTQEEAYTEVKTSGALKYKGWEQLPSDTQTELKIDALSKDIQALEDRIAQSGMKHQDRLAEPAPSTSITATSRVPNRDNSLWRQRSGSYIDINASKPEPRFHEGQQVHITENIGSIRMKRGYQISKARYDRSKGYTEYQLLEPLKQLLHNKGAWYRERDLNQGSWYDTGGSNDDFEDAQSKV